MRCKGDSGNVYARIAVIFAAPSSTRRSRLPSFRLSVLSFFARSIFNSITTHSQRLPRPPLSNIRLSSASGALVFSHRYRYYLKPHRVFSSTEESRGWYRNANDSFLRTKARDTLFDCGNAGELAEFVTIVSHPSGMQE